MFQKKLFVLMKDLIVDYNKGEMVMQLGFYHFVYIHFEH
jgi:hypothetical protein